MIATPTPGSLGTALPGLAVLAAALAAGSETETNGFGMELVRIPPGSCPRREREATP